ncbi:glycine zipper 2TM domain-containing protein [Pedobacter changchengzhani]|uniref:Glycine zipper 2TM domain-containing protein n=1 Tax=Pedobacter changchengzhani TaxID=2529274 RepID=A0A4R5MHI8_9SPHI|nr:YMGG-like glycine zipper-containing protein [Pedobacter changchengzhani]TDG34982.1 glycine zipper 2TM domain-containing protein [Pedobacter changchengzhani]
MKKIFVVIALTSTVLFACNNKAKEEATLKQQEVEKQATIKVVKDSMRLDSFKKAELTKQKQIEDSKQAAAVATARKEGARSANVRSSGNGSGTANSAYGGTQPTAKKKGWSEAAKGAVIGGAAGAVGGALIDKKKGRGAIIGGVVGAGGGYLIGRGADKKSGRAN